MIKVLGPRRLFVLFVLIGVNAVLAFLLYYQLVPQQLELEREVRIAQRTASEKQEDIQKLQIELDKLVEQQDIFNALERDGFLGSQNRRDAERLFESTQQQNQIISAVASVRPAVIDNNEVAAKADHVILSSPVEITLEAIDDIDIYRYLVTLLQRFPGHLSIDEVLMSREMDISNPVLRGISVGEDIGLVKGTLNLSWRTMVPQERANRIISDQEQARRIR